MSYLPVELPSARVLITVKTYPLPSSDHGEVVCTAGLVDGEKWVRMYPISFRLYDEKKYPKYSWVELNLVKHPSDFRLESYMPRNGLDEPMQFIDRLSTDNHWSARKEFVYKEVFTSMDQLIALSRSENKSLGTLKPTEVTDFVVEETERDWKPQWQDKLRQYRIFDLDDAGLARPRRLIRKLPFTFKYRFLAEGDSKPRELSIRDWEIGTLFWKCLRQTDGDEQAAVMLVRHKYFDDFTAQKDLLFFLGTTYEFHKRRVDNPFIIIGFSTHPERSSSLCSHHPSEVRKAYWRYLVSRT